MIRAAILTLAFAAPALAHDAPSGWTYDPHCCGGHDCAPVSVDAVSPVGEGYAVRLLPGEHPMVNFLPFDDFVPFGSDAIRPSPDGFYHVCIVSGAVRCLYVPVGS